MNVQVRVNASNHLFQTILITDTIFPQPLEKEIIDYKPQIDEVNKVGQTYDEVVQEVEQPLSSGPHQRSLEAGSGHSSPRRSRQSMSLLERSSLHGMEGGYCHLICNFINLNTLVYALHEYRVAVIGEQGRWG